MRPWNETGVAEQADAPKGHLRRREIVDRLYERFRGDGKETLENFRQNAMRLLALAAPQRRFDGALGHGVVMNQPAPIGERCAKLFARRHIPIPDPVEPALARDGFATGPGNEIAQHLSMPRVKK